LDAPDVCDWQLDRHPTSAALGHGAHERHDPVARVEKTLGLEAIFGPHVPQHHE
jgi:hypothetical protein